jgi:hypothetical protein
MYDNDTKTQFIMLRSYGWSINRISQELQISRPTLIKWNEDYGCLIRSLRAAELEELHESILEKHQAEIARLSKQQKAIAKELAERNLSDISTEKLYSLDALLRAEIQKNSRDRRPNHQRLRLHPFTRPSLGPLRTYRHPWLSKKS